MRSRRALTLPPSGPQKAAPDPIFQIFNREYELLEVIENKGRTPLLIGTKTALFEDKAKPPVSIFHIPAFRFASAAFPCNMVTL
jgi:hypothetical protein